MARFKLDTGNSGDDEILEGETRADVLQDVLNHHGIDELPEGWTLEEIEPKNRHAVATHWTTTDGLAIYDLDPLSAEMWALAGPAGHDPKTIDTDDLPEGFRWVEGDEWEELGKLRKFNHRTTKLGFELVDLPLPVGVETEVFLTEGCYVTGCGKLYGVHDSPWHAFQPDADARALGTLGASSLPSCLQELAVRNSERLGAAIQCQWEATEGTGNVVAATWKHACDWLASEITLEEQAAGAWGWIESPNDDEGRFYVAKENMD
jgi:hypothetical protein